MNASADHLHDLFSRFGAIRVKKMFGGFGVFRENIMFALVADDTLFFKVDAKSVRPFEERGLPQFTYEKNGRLIGMSYRKAPDEIFDDPEEAATWASRAFEAALRSRSRGE